MIVRKSANFVLNEASFVIECSNSFDEKFNEEQDKICHLKPIDEILNILLTVDVFEKELVLFLKL